MAQTLAEKHFSVNRHPGASRAGQHVMPENELWAYIVQIANGLKAVHEGGLGRTNGVIVKGSTDIQESTSLECMRRLGCRSARPASVSS